MTDVATGVAPRPVPDTPRVAVLVPCFNEASSVGTVVKSFNQALPAATLYVYDNNSTDATAARAAEAGALVRSESRQGKGYVVGRMFADVDADVYVMVDGDGTYDAGSVRRMVDMVVEQNFDMVVGARQALARVDDVYRRGHSMGNHLFNTLNRWFFGSQFTDVFSGYRAMSRRFVKSLPLRSSGFEVETEITVHAVELGAPCKEIQTPYGPRQGESTSKLRTYSDGFRIMRTALALLRMLRPLRFFTTLFALFTIVSIALAVPIVTEFARTGLVPRFPTAILAAATQTLAFIFLTAGFVLENVSAARREARLLAYLAIPAPSG